MLITFKTKAYANITMFGDVGRRMLEMMDFGTSLPGAIREEDVPRGTGQSGKRIGTDIGPGCTP